MKIGFTYDLKDDFLQKGFSKEDVAEFDSMVTIEAIKKSIEAEGHEVTLVGNAFSLIEQLLSGNKWDLVFNICEGLYGSGRESLVPALLDMYNIPYTFSTPLEHAITLNKAVAKKILRDSGLPVSDFIVIADASRMPSPDWEFPYFVKALSEGTGKSVTPASKVFSMDECRRRCAEVIAEFHQPAIVEPFLSGREVTVGVLGTGASAKCIGVMEVSFTENSDLDAHTYFNKENCETAAAYSLATDYFAIECARIAVGAHRVLNLRDASRVDIRASKSGEPMIIEVNSLPGLMPNRSDLILLANMAGISHQHVIIMILNSAIQRCV